MSDTPPATDPASATPAPGAPPAGVTPATPPAPSSATPPAAPDPAAPATTPAPDAATLEARLKAANAEAAENRRKAKAAEDRLAALEAEKLTDAEKLQRDHDNTLKELEASKARARTLAITSELTAAAAAAGLRPEDARAFLESDIELDGDGNPIGVADKVKALAAERPYLVVGLTPGQAGPGASAPGSTAKPTYTRKQLTDPDFYREHQADIMAAASEGRITD